MCNKRFLEEFIAQLYDTYKQYSRLKIRLVSFRRSNEHQFYKLTFEIAHPRRCDTIYIRLENNEITLDITPGECKCPYLITSKGGKWIEMVPEDKQSPLPYLTKKSAEKVELIARVLYEKVAEKQEALKFLLKEASDQVVSRNL